MNWVGAAEDKMKQLYHPKVDNPKKAETRK